MLTEWEEALGSEIFHSCHLARIADEWSIVTSGLSVLPVSCLKTTWQC